MGIRHSSPLWSFWVLACIFSWICNWIHILLLIVTSLISIVLFLITCTSLISQNKTKLKPKLNNYFNIGLNFNFQWCTWNAKSINMCTLFFKVWGPGIYKSHFHGKEVTYHQNNDRCKFSDPIILYMIHLPCYM